MFKFGVYFRNIEVINYFYLEEVCLQTLLMIWYYTRHSLNLKIIIKLHLTVQKGAQCCA